jgi:hypothetical protein
MFRAIRPVTMPACIPTTALHYSNVQTFGNPPTCFGLFSGHSQGSMEQRKIEKWLITSYVYDMNLVDRNYWCVTGHVKCAKISPSTSLHFSSRVWRWRVVCLCWFWRFFVRAVASRMGASKSFRVSTFLLQISLSIQPHNQKCNNSTRQIQTALSR